MKATNPAVSTPDGTDILADDRGAQDIFQKHPGWHWDGRPGRETGAADGVSHQQLSSQLYGQLLLSRSLSGPLYSPGSVNLICSKRKRVFSVKTTAFSVKTKKRRGRFWFIPNLLSRC